MSKNRRNEPNPSLFRLFFCTPLLLHFRLAELKSTLGIEDEKQSISASAIFLKCIGASMGEKPVLVKNLPATTTVGKLKNLCESFFKLKSVKPILFLQEEVGRDVSQCLQQALSRKGLDIQVTGLINYTVGTLAVGHYHDEDTLVAVIIGTGTNACYLERADAIIKCQGLLTTSRDMVVNVEWGNFWSSHLPRTSYDIDLDAESPNPNDQSFEKMISGMYLGDIVRRVILRMSQELDVFGPHSSKLHVPFILSLQVLSRINITTNLNMMKSEVNGANSSTPM